MKLSISSLTRRPCVLRRSQVALALLAASFAGTVAGQVLPTGFESMAGDITATVNGSTMDVTQAAQRGIAHWNDFSIGAGGTVNVIQPGASSVLLNRVVGYNVSSIYGALNANGHVYLVNPAGIVFGPGAQVNVGGIVASTLDLAGDTVTERNAAFLAGGPLNFANAEGRAVHITVEPGAELRARGSAGDQALVALLADGVVNAGRIEADGGTVALASGSRIGLDPVGDGLTTLRVDSAALGDGALSGLAQNSGLMAAAGGTVLVLSDGALGRVVNSMVDGDGAPSAGRIVAHGGQIVLDAGDGSTHLSGTLDASGDNGDHGGLIMVLGGDLLLDGVLLARGSDSGGFIETSAPNFRIGPGFAVDASASAPEGQAGTWLLDPQNIEITDGSGVPPIGDPWSDASITDGMINTVLDSGTSVTIQTVGNGSSSGGDVNFQPEVEIRRTTAGGPVNFTVNADGSIRTLDGGVIIESTGGPLNVTLNADAQNPGSDAVPNGGRIDLQDTIINTNGGDIAMHANWRGIDEGAAIALSMVSLDSGDGSIALAGFNSLDGSGVLLQDTQLRASAAGTVAITGVGHNSQPYPGDGVELRGSSIETADGDIRVHGRVSDEIAAAPMAGTVVDNDSSIVSGNGHVDVVGSADSGGANSAGLEIAGRIDTGGHVTLRASNDGNADALVISSTTPGIHAGGMLNLRPGEVSASGTASDRTSEAIWVGAAHNGFSLTTAELGSLSAGNAIVIGSSVHAGTITVDDGISLAGSLTLQNEGAGSGGISLQAPVTLSTGGVLGLLSAGNVAQGPGAAITAPQVLARSSGASVVLDDAANNAGTVSGGAPSGSFTWVDADAVRLAPVAATGAQAAVNTPQAVAPASLAAGNVRVQTLSGDLTLAQPLSSSAGADLVAAGLFQNPGTGSAGGAPWRVWASSWEGESRGGMSGSGSLPNLYNCAYGGPCGVSIPAGANHFIYAAQPTATVNVNDASRPLGWPNPPLTHAISGLILGDGAAAVTGGVTTVASLLSPVGSYPITGSFTSPAGYAVVVNPGTLSVTEFEQPPVAQIPTLELPWHDAPGEGSPAGAPICLASEPLAGDGQLADGDMLAREWSRVRTRPQLTNCLRSSRREACSDF